MGSQPTMRPPPRPLLFRICTGKLASRATTRYAFAVPNVDSFVLSEYKINARGFPSAGSWDFQVTMDHRQRGMKLWLLAHLGIPKCIGSPWLINKPHELVSIILVESLCIKDSMRSDVWITQQTSRPVPQGTKVYIKTMFFFTIWDRYNSLFELRI